MELLNEIQNITGFNTFRIWRCSKPIQKGTFRSKRYTRKGDAINWIPEALLGKKEYILVCVNSITGTTYEWI
jgi:hypothetical protein